MYLNADIAHVSAGTCYHPSCGPVTRSGADPSGYVPGAGPPKAPPYLLGVAFFGSRGRGYCTGLRAFTTDATDERHSIYEQTFA